MKRELKRQQTKQLLLDTTKQLIEEKGCANMTLNDIMQRSGLSKGAIFHYVKGKDELLAMVLEERLEETNARFLEATRQGTPEFAGPMNQIAGSLRMLEERQDAANQVFIYLLGKSDQPDVAAVTKRFYEHAFGVSKQWILAGQHGGVIPPSIDADKTADLFVLISFGLRMRSSIGSDALAFGSADFGTWMANLLQPKTLEE